MSKIAEMQAWAAQMDLAYDTESDVIFGKRSGYALFLTKSSDKGYILHLSVAKNGVAPDRETLKSDLSEVKNLRAFTVKNTKIDLPIKPGMTKAKTQSRTAEAVAQVLEALQNNSYQNACQFSGQTGETAVYVLNNALFLLSEESYSQLLNEQNQEQQLETATHENMIAGTIGAFLGAVIGLIATVIVGQMGYVSIWTGIIMGVCAVKGYELLAKKFSLKGAIISLVFVLVLTYVAHQVDLALTLSRRLGTDFFETFQNLSNIIKLADSAGSDTSQLIVNLVLMYICALAGALPMIYTSLKNQKSKYVTRRL